MLVAIGSGVVIGLVIAMVAVSFTLIFNATGVVNYANGQFMLLGGYLSWYFQTELGIPFVPMVALTLVGAAILGVLVDRIVIGPLRTATLLVQVTGLVALASVLDGVFRHAFGPDPRNIPNYLPMEAVVPGVNWSQTDIAIMVVTLALIVLLFLGLYRTNLGTYMRATADNPLAVGLVGVNPARVAVATWAVAGAIGALAGVLLLPKLLLSPAIGLSLTLLAFSAVVLGGFGSLTGAVIGGLLIGVVQAVVAETVGGGWEPLVSLAVMLVVLTARPTGLLGERA
jgi:branched-chain amino acid transport system permease protein